MRQRVEQEYERERERKREKEKGVCVWGGGMSERESNREGEGVIERLIQWRERGGSSSKGD